MSAARLPSAEERFPARALRWRLRSIRLELPLRPLVMGIVNVTPDSFSDGGMYLDPQAAIEHGLTLVQQGAEILDVGGESTRPYSAAVSASEEMARVLPVIEGLRRQTTVPISIDTSKALVARLAVEAGAEIINDVTALAGDPEMVRVVLDTGAAVCAMHMQGTPQTMQDHPSYADVCGEVQSYLQFRRDALAAAGVAWERIALDPGIGFGKTHQHNLDLLAGAHRLHELQCPLLVGPSRKGFIGKWIGDSTADRMPGTVGVVLSLAQQGVQIVRVHDVAAVRQALSLFEATGGLDGRAGRIA